MFAGDIRGDDLNGLGDRTEHQNGLRASDAIATIPHGVPGSAYIIARGEGPRRRFLVRFKLGGREAKIEHAGSFKRKSDAVLRRNLIAGMLAAGLGKEIRKRLRAGVDDAPLTVTEAGKGWLGSRIDISSNTVRIHGDSLRRLEPLIGDVPIEDLVADDVATAVTTLSETCKPSTVRKSLNVLQQALDHAQLEPNPARDRRIRLPRQQRVQIVPPETAHVEEVVRALPARYRLPVLALDATGMRISELLEMTWGDVDEHAGRWRVRASTAKTGMPRWIDPVDPDIHAAVCALTPREDRDLGGKVFPDLDDARLRTAITRACKATGTPHFSPHDLRHRRISLLVLRGTPIPRVSAFVGHARGSMTLDTYSHVLLEATELEYPDLLVLRS
jgi:integrase